jgi:hypothetical protein
VTYRRQRQLEHDHRCGSAGRRRRHGADPGTTVSAALVTGLRRSQRLTRDLYGGQRCERGTWRRVPRSATNLAPSKTTEMKFRQNIEYGTRWWLRRVCSDRAAASLAFTLNRLSAGNASVTSCGVASPRCDTERRQRRERHAARHSVSAQRAPARDASVTLVALPTRRSAAPERSGSQPAEDDVVPRASAPQCPRRASWYRYAVVDRNDAPAARARGTRASRLPRASRTPRHLTVSSWHLWGGPANADQRPRAPHRRARPTRMSTRTRRPRASAPAATPQPLVLRATPRKRVGVRPVRPSSCAIPTTGGADSATLSLYLLRRPPRASTATPRASPARAGTPDLNQAQTLTYAGSLTTSLAGGTTSGVRSRFR